MPKERHFVYVIELDKDVLYESKFKKANPEYETGKPCVYVGMTGHDPDTRFDQHKAGIKANIDRHIALHTGRFVVATGSLGGLDPSNLVRGETTLSNRFVRRAG